MKKRKRRRSVKRAPRPRGVPPEVKRERVYLIATMMARGEAPRSTPVSTSSDGECLSQSVSGL